MASEKATALVLRVVQFSETSSIVTLFTREFGKLRAIAKGARRPKGPFESALDLLALCRIVFRPKSSDALDLLTEAKLERRFRPFERDLASLYAGYYVAELLIELTDQHDPHPPLFDLADGVLADLSRGGPVASLVLRFELVALRILGHLPSLDRCVVCGTAVEDRPRVAFGQWEGGVLCHGCRIGKRHVVLVSADVMRAIRDHAGAGDAWRQAQTPLAETGELRAVMNHYLSHLVGHPLRLHRCLATLAGNRP
ncbi:MAG: DNA repair protein RecO [Planctomycetes bacterium RBG_16_64_10]|nr:MAG: DNA repair protein RecO [Planctomycetes bacterium RBG_16_64_10]